jgi:hypothetical protein
MARLMDGRALYHRNFRPLPRAATNFFDGACNLTMRRFGRQISEPCSMNNRVFDKTKLPSRHVTKGTSHAPHRSYLWVVNENLRKVVWNPEHTLSGPPTSQSPRWAVSLVSGGARARGGDCEGRGHAGSGTDLQGWIGHARNAFDDRGALWLRHWFQGRAGQRGALFRRDVWILRRPCRAGGRR